MPKMRTIRFDYYFVACRDINSDPQDSDGRFDLNQWMQIITSCKHEDRTIDYYEEKAKLDSYRHNDLEKYWFLNFMRLRDTNTPKKAYIDKEAQNLVLNDDEYIGEDVNAIYDEKHNILMLQRNIHSLSVSGIEKYMNFLWNGREGRKIYLRPIKAANVYERATKRDTCYRKFTIRFADMDDGNKFKNRKSGSLKSIYDSFIKYEGVVAEVTVSMGYNKAGLNNETVVETINEIMENRDIISKAEVSIKDGVEPVDMLDLFSDKMNDLIQFYLEPRQSLASEYVEDGMYERYRESRAMILHNL